MKLITATILYFVLAQFYYDKASFDNKINIETIQLCHFTTDYDPDYSQIFKYEYPVALELLKQNVKLFNTTFSTYKIDTALAVSIVFPEFIRFSNYKDILETHSLEVIYVNLGKEYIDFSIGLMQMKPSFAEKLENYIENSVKLSVKYSFLTNYSSSSEKEIRAERISRLKSVQWQMFYLCSFCDVVSDRFSHAVFISKAAKIKFYATAYNCDFLSSQEKINKQINLRYFPYGKNWVMPQYAYSEVAAHFYLHYYSQI